MVFFNIIEEFKAGVCSSKAKRCVSMALRIEQTPAEQPRLSGESACWWEKHGWVLFPINKLMKKTKPNQSRLWISKGIEGFS